ncbi:MAG TPA: tetratricopeptide repeat protein [Thermoanaerobaculia bacterium]
MNGALRQAAKLGVLLLAWTLSAAVAGTQSTKLLPVPAVDTEGMEPAIRQEIEQDRRSLEKAIAELPAGSAELAEAYGRHGQITALYKLNAIARICLENAVRLAPAELRWTYSLGALLQATGDFSAAEERFVRSLELRPGDPAILIRLGEVRLNLGHLAEARQAFEAALPASGAAAAAHFGLGRVALIGEDARAAAAHFEAALAAQPGAAEVRAPLAVAYRKLKRLDDARAALAAYGEGRVTFPDPILDQVARMDVGSQRFLQSGASALREKRFPDAVQAYRKALESEPANATAWMNLGVGLEGSGDPAGAEKSYRKAVELQPSLARAHYDLGTLLAGRGAIQEGLEHLETAVRLDPESRDALFNLGQALEATEEPARALDTYDCLLKLAPQDLDARFHRGQTLAALGRPAEAADELGRVVAAEPREAAPRIAQVIALLGAGRDAEARARLEEGHKALPQSEPLAQLLVRVLAGSSHSDVRDGGKALEIAQSLLAAGPTAEREEVLALALGETKRFAEAADHLHRALAALPPDSPDHSRLEHCLSLYEQSEPCRAPGS